MASFTEAFAGALDGTGVEDYDADLTGDVTLDVWLGADDYLPYLFTMSGEMGTPEGTMTLEMTFTVDSYNEAVDIPEAPADATSFEDLFGGFDDASDDADSGWEDILGAGS
jgi:hypothetical protein